MFVFLLYFFFQTPSVKLSSNMPKQVTDIKEFLVVARRKDAREVRIKKDKKKNTTKFKVRCSRFLYTLVMKNSENVDKLRQSLPTNLEVKEI